jgi:hypothetical protein
MEKLNLQKEPVIEILRLIDKKMAEVMTSARMFSDNTVIVNFSVNFYISEDEIKGDVYFGPMGRLTPGPIKEPKS